MSEYGNDRIKPSQKSYSVGCSSTFGAGSSGDSKHGRTVINSLVSCYGAGPEVDTTHSCDANSFQAKTRQTELQSSRTSPGSSDSRLTLPHTYGTTTSSVPSDVNGRSNGRQSRATDRSGTTRVRSASQV